MEFYEEVSVALVGGDPRAIVLLADPFSTPMPRLLPTLNHCWPDTPVVGGMASVGGAVVAAIILGFIHTFVATLADSTIAAMVGVGIMALTLVVRPQGLLGRETP